MTATPSRSTASQASQAYDLALEVIASVEPRVAEATRKELADQRSSLKLIASENYASQPSFIGGFASDVSSLVVTNTKLDVEQGSNNATISFPNTTVGSLVEGLARAKVDTRRMISILQAIKAAGALHAEIVVQ